MIKCIMKLQDVCNTKIELVGLLDVMKMGVHIEMTEPLRDVVREWAKEHGRN